MYKLLKDTFYPHEQFEVDKKYLIEVLRKFKALEDEEYFYLPDKLNEKIKELKIDKDIYNYFVLVWANEKKEIPIESIIGSHDYRDYPYTWLEHFITKSSSKDSIEKYFNSPSSIFNDKKECLKVFESNGEYYLADGHHRFVMLYIHYQILKSRGLLPNDFPTSIQGIVRVIPKNIEFIKRFVDFCILNNLFKEDEFGVIPLFEVTDSNPLHPIICYSGSDILIDENSDLNEILEKINSYKKENGVKL